MDPSTGSQQCVPAAVYNINRTAIKLTYSYSDYGVVNPQIPKPPISAGCLGFSGACGQLYQNPIELFAVDSGCIPTDPSCSSSACVRHCPLSTLTSISRFASGALAPHPSRKKGSPGPPPLYFRTTDERSTSVANGSGSSSGAYPTAARFSFSVRKLTFSSSRSDARKHRYGDASHRSAPTSLLALLRQDASRSAVSASIWSRSGRRSRVVCHAGPSHDASAFAVRVTSGRTVDLQKARCAS